MNENLNDYLSQLGKVFGEVFQLRNEGSAASEDKLAEKRKYALLLFVLIKKCNRLVKYKVRLGRDELHKEKLTVDSNQLQLQNLFYEVNHLKREIRNCYHFKSQDEDIDLLPEDQFLQTTGANAALESEHAVRLARLEWELSLRKNLSKNCEDLIVSKQKMLKELVKKMEGLTSFGPCLQTMLEATKPLQNVLQMPFEKTWKLEQLVQLLPQPLYLLYINVKALETQDANTRIRLVGSKDRVNKMDFAAQIEHIKYFDKIYADYKNFGLVKNKRRHSDNDQDKKSMVLQPHPLMITIELGKEEEKIAVNIRYFPLLHVVTAADSIITKDEVIVGEISQDILKHLYPHDQGDAIPLTAIESELEEVDSNAAEFLQYLLSNDFGRPFYWVQRLCGINVCSTDKAEVLPTKLQKCMKDIINEIHCLWMSRLNLIKELKFVINKSFDAHFQSNNYLSKPSCSLVQFSAVSLEEYECSSFRKSTENTICTKFNHIFYRAVLVRGSAKMECLISISNKFPMDNPFWTLCVYWNGQHNALNNAAIKEMEFWTNSLEQKDVESELGLLASQLIRTMYSFDIFLETEGPLYSPDEYNKDKKYLKAFAKRTRCRPIKVLKKGLINSFK